MAFDRKLAIALVSIGLAAPSAATAADAPPPPPVAAGGAKVKTFATGVGLPTQIAFAGGNAFVAGAAEGPFKGGLFVVRPGKKKAVKVPGTPKSVFGVAARGGRVFVSSGRDLIAYSKFNGRRFRQAKRLYRGPKKFNGFSGLAIAPNGRIHAGVSLNQKYDNVADPSPWGNSVMSIKPNGKGLKRVATGLRQPWMMTFAKGVKDPFVSVLGQDAPVDNGAPDLIVRARPGQDYGFPECSWLVESACKGFAEPVVKLEALDNGEGGLAQQSPMGIGAIGSRLFVALFSGNETGPGVIQVKTDGTGLRPFMTGFAAPVLSVATHKGYVYAGDLTGTIYRVKG